jgi:methionyl-tRNA synthetase
VAFYVTTPIYYVNAAPHLGHAYSTIAADVLARHHRQRGEDVFFLTGTDEHGEPVAEAAEREGVSPEELAGRNAVRFQELWPRLGVSNDFFIRTSDPRHGAKVQEVLERVRENGHVYEGTYDGWYCPRCADFKTDADVGPGNTCQIHKTPLTREREDNWFFRLSAFQEPLERLFEERPDFVMPRHRYNEARAFIASGLQDISLTRARLRWGVPVPWDPGQVFYVWWDALLNYYTALAFAQDEDLTSRFWPATFHVIGKDILRFHTIFWPALLMAAELELPRHVFVHGYLLSPPAEDSASAADDDTAGGVLEKMSKSRGNVIDPFAVAHVFGADALRHYCFREVTFGHDGPVSESGFAVRYESELANEYGNLAARTLAMIRRYREGVVPDVAPEDPLAADFEGLPDRVAELLDRADLSAALDEIWDRVRRLNRYVEERAPWVLARDDAQAARLDQVLAGLAEGLRVVTVLLHPYMPDTAGRLLDALGRPAVDYDQARFRAAAGGARVADLEPLFPKDPEPVSGRAA